MFEPLIVQAFIIIVLCSGVPLLISAGVGLIVSVVQAATQIQDQTVTYMVKFGAVCATMALLAPWFGGELIRFMQEMLLRTASFGRM